MEIGSIAQIGSLALAALALLVSVLGSSRKGWEERIGSVAKASEDRTAALARSLSETERRVADIDDRVIKMERDLAHLPDNETAHRMEMAIARLEGRLEVMSERLMPVAAIATRMQDYLMGRGDAS
ncbi:hypothetical protein [Prosthecomicrobium hirschii]|jgi:septal ring factor EnvC (AmiA/AmiB activator)|uniref:hypothetical protein n=1 Tax=Prosthecodimorpha hirschii TaxID=665126 RepID=UPI00221F89FC|nr:hypothetical protein [Prosthecomicrobium hirschii]MCW1842285.1 hypothetical protein [Prosthecomicrobium hirschii]